MDETREEIINNETEDTKDVQTAETAVQEPEKKEQPRRRRGVAIVAAFAAGFAACIGVFAALTYGAGLGRIVPKADYDYYEDLSSKTLAALLGSYQKGELPFQYIKSTYTHSGDTYTIANYGTVKKAAGNRVNISLTAAAFSDNFNGSLEIGGAASHNNTTYLCRKWSIANVEVKASNGEKTFSASSTLYNIVTSIIKDGLLDMNGSDMTDYDKFGRFVNFYFSQNERLVALYGNNHIYTGEWEWSNAAKGTFTYDLEHSFMGNVLFPNVSTSCKAEFNASTCVFTLTSKYTYQKKTYSLDVAFTLR